MPDRLLQQHGGDLASKVVRLMLRSGHYNAVKWRGYPDLIAHELLQPNRRHVSCKSLLAEMYLLLNEEDFYCNSTSRGASPLMKAMSIPSRWDQLWAGCTSGAREGGQWRTKIIYLFKVVKMSGLDVPFPQDLKDHVRCYGMMKLLEGSSNDLAFGGWLVKKMYGGLGNYLDAFMERFKKRVRRAKKTGKLMGVTRQLCEEIVAAVIFTTTTITTTTTTTTITTTTTADKEEMEEVEREVVMMGLQLRNITYKPGRIGVGMTGMLLSQKVSDMMVRVRVRVRICGLFLPSVGGICLSLGPLTMCALNPSPHPHFLLSCKCM